MESSYKDFQLFLHRFGEADEYQKPDLVKNNIGNNILDAMKHNNMILSDLEKATGISRREIKYYTGDKASVQQEMIESISQGLGVESYELFAYRNIAGDHIEESGKDIAEKRRCLAALHGINDEAVLDKIIREMGISQD